MEVLRGRVDAQPGDAEAARLLAETLYWMKDVSAARAEYERALARHSGHVGLRLDYGRVLVELRDDRRAQEVLGPLLDSSSANAHASAAALLGTIAYWSGDLVEARRRFEEALSTDGSQAEARRQLAEILALTAPWVEGGGSLLTDDQPLDRTTTSLQAEWFPRALTSLRIELHSTVIDVGAAASASVDEAALALTHYAPGARLEVDGRGGLLRRSFGEARDWTGRAGIGLRLGGGAVLRARAEREPYLWTVASARRPVMVENATALVAVDTHGWLGEAALTRRRYPDENTVDTRYAWLLAPVVRSRAAELRVGYGVSAQDSAEVRFVPAAAPGVPGTTVPGRYDPYHTPIGLSAHSGLAAVVLRAGRVRLDAGGSYGFRAQDDEPVLQVPFAPAGAPPVLLFERRSFHPFSVRGSAQARWSAFTLTAGGERMRTVFYSATRIGVQARLHLPHHARSR